MSTRDGPARCGNARRRQIMPTVWAGRSVRESREKVCPAQNRRAMISELRSSNMYCTASARCNSWMFAAPSMSAIVAGTAAPCRKPGAQPNSSIACFIMASGIGQVRSCLMLPGSPWGVCWRCSPRRIAWPAPSGPAHLSRIASLLVPASAQSIPCTAPPALGVDVRSGS